MSAQESTEADPMLLSRFKGALVGAVVADCIGARFEMMPKVKVALILDIYMKLKKWREDQREKGTRPVDVYGLEYTDDTAMARCIMNSLLDKQTLDSGDLAKRFADEYYSARERGYGGNVISVFEKLKDPALKDVFEPARQQFDGSGSYGNGGAMRIVPAPLFLFQQNSLTELEKISSSITRLTHTHSQAVNGALLQAFAVDLSLRLPQSGSIDCDSFCDELIKRLKPIEEAAQNGNTSTSPPPAKKIYPKRKLDAEPLPYCAKLEKIKEFSRADKLTPSTVEKVLGNDVSALGSVPAAVLSFLRGVTKGVDGVEEENPFKRVVTYAISLGGDTDTIATMAAAMAGAFFGLEKIPEEWQYYCEGVADAEIAAEKFYNLVKQQQQTVSASESKSTDETLL